MQINGARGKLFVIGGKVDREGGRRIFGEFVRHAGGAGARVVLMTAATGGPRESGEEEGRTPRRSRAESGLH
jgi:cyanophycinase-like exopeptidase